MIQLRCCTRRHSMMLSKSRLKVKEENQFREMMVISSCLSLKVKAGHPLGLYMTDSSVGISFNKFLQINGALVVDKLNKRTVLL